MDLEPLLRKLAALAPQFGRAREDIEAMVSRGRSADYKGVMQNARLVLEAVARSMVREELGQQPGKAMLDELITKFRQQANAGLVPTNILAHMGTVQAWGNLSSHDHAAGLTDAGVKVGEDEAVASLNSMVAILTWYAAKYPAPAGPSTPAPAAPTPSTAAAARSRAPLVLGVVAILLLAGLGGATAAGVFRKPVLIPVGGPVLIAGASPTAARAQLDALYASREEPAPPAACRAGEDTEALAKAPAEALALEQLAGQRSAEAWYLLARARIEAHQPAGDALTHALECPGFAAAVNLSGKAAIEAQRLDDAAAAFQSALEIAPGFHRARLNLALVRLKQQRISEGMAELRKIVQSQPSHGEAHFFLGVALEGQGQKPDAAREFCEAWRLGVADARSHCPAP